LVGNGQMSRFMTWLLTSRRRWVQATAFLVMNSYFFQNLKAVPCPGMNCYACPASIFACPIGTLQHFAVLRQIPFYLLGVLSLIGVTVGRLACGWACPFGWLQELMHGLGARLSLKPWKMSGRWSWLRYAFLIILAVLIPILTLEPWFSKLCPVGTLQGGIPLILSNAELRGQAGALFLVKLCILVAFLVWMMRTKRPFCRFVCPLGAIWSPFNRLSTLRLVVDEAHCTQCEACRRVCPVDIAIYENAASTQCIRCMECIKACPEAAIRLVGE